MILEIGLLVFVQINAREKRNIPNIFRNNYLAIWEREKERGKERQIEHHPLLHIVQTLNSRWLILLILVKSIKFQKKA